MIGYARDPKRHFHELSHDEQCAAVRRMAADGATDVGIAMATGWSCEYVAHVIGLRDDVTHLRDGSVTA